MKIEPIAPGFQLKSLSPGAWPSVRAVTLVRGEGEISFEDGVLLVPYSRHEEMPALVARINAACEKFGLPPLAQLVDKPLDLILP